MSDSTCAHGVRQRVTRDCEWASGAGSEEQGRGRTGLKVEGREVREGIDENAAREGAKQGTMWRGRSGGEGDEGS